MRRTDIQQGQIPGIFEMTLLGPDLVHELGPEQVASAPAWYHKIFADGGAMLVPGQYLDIDPTHPYEPTREAVARHLGLPFIWF